MTRPRADLAGLGFSYPEVGATTGELPPGYRHLEVERLLGDGEVCFRRAVATLMSWDMHRRAGLEVELVPPVGGRSAPSVTAGQTAVLAIGLGPVTVRAPVRVVGVTAEPSRQGFAYGTLPGHPERGEEQFLVHHDDDGTVRATIRAFSRPDRWFTRLGGPVAHRVQDRTTQRYLDALAAS